MKCIAMILATMAAVVVAAVGAVDFFDLVKEEWNTFKLEHRKSYTEFEDRFRMKIFAENRHKIAKHNQKYEMGLVSFSLKLNKYSDMLHHEFTQTMNGFNRTAKHHNGSISKNRQQTVGATFIAPAHVTLPEEVDWRKKGAVTEVKNQGMCGSCWAFSSTGSLEGQHYRKAGFLVSLSEQNLIDCSTKYGNNGCNGGLMDYAFTYIKDNKGVDTEKSYPYEAIVDKCRYDPHYVGAVDVGFVDIPQGDEKKLKIAVATVGPISVAIDASLYTFQQYSTGVYYDEDCSSDKLDHGVLVVGYGTDEKGGDYWLVKNSWGSSWGINGYIKMARNRNNHCGIATRASYPLV